MYCSVRERDLLKLRGGIELLKQANGSLERALRDAFPEHLWQSEMFNLKLASYSSSNLDAEANAQFKLQRRILDKLSFRLGIQTQEQWYAVSVSQLAERGGNYHT